MLPCNAAWGQHGAFPALETLRLSDNAAVGGTLPDWGAAQDGSLANLTVLRIKRNGLTGSLPPWRGLLKLTEISLETSQLTGCMPAIRCEPAAVAVLFCAPPHKAALPPSLICLFPRPRCVADRHQPGRSYFLGIRNGPSSPKRRYKFCTCA